jgi:uncharacterized protein (TIGR00304 family)
LVVYSLPYFLAKFIKALHPNVNEEKMDFILLYALAAIFIVVGIIVVFLAIFQSTRDSEKEDVKGAGVIMIGPIPIIFGTDKKSVKTVIILALALTIALIILYLFMLTC